MMSTIEIKPIKNKKSFAGEVFEFVHLFFVAIVLAGLINCFVFQLIKIEQTSMVPTFEDQERILLNKWVYNFDAPKCGDIIVFYEPIKNQNLIKRVIGVPGDTIEIRDGKVIRNGIELNEPYINETTLGTYSVVVPEGSYFCMGDNRNVSIDSRNSEIGCIPRERILGKVFFRIKGFQKVESYDHSRSDKNETL